MTATSFPKNPYIIGRPIHDSDNFYGREEIFQFIEDNLLNEVQVILLFGQRRIGKSSIINQIPLAVKLENFVFIPLSLQGKSHKSLGQVLFELATDIRDSINDYLEASEVDITIPKVENFKQNHKIFVEQFLVQIYDILEARNLVLLIDEFDVLEDTKKDSAINQFFPYLYSILPETKQLFLIPVVGRKLDDIPSLISLFKEAPYKQIGILDKYYAKQLICQPTKGILNFDANSIQAILDLSGGHPYFIQLICFTLFGRLRQEQKYHVSREDVTEIVDKAIEHGEGGLAWFYAGLTIPEKLIFSVVAELQEHKNTDLWQFLKQQKISKKESLVNAYDRLSSWGFIQQEWKQIPNPIQIEKITVELVRHWLLRRHPAEQEIRTYKELLRAYTTKIMRRYLPSSVAALTLIIGGFGWWYSPWGQIQRVRWELTALSNRTSNDYRQKAALAFSKDGSLQRAIASAESIIDSFTKTKTLITISENFRILENFSDAEKSLERAIAVAQQIPRSSDKVRALTAISEIYVTLESFPKAEKSLELAIAAAESITDSRLKAEVLIAITETYGKLENFPQVAQSLELAIAAAQEISDSLFKAEVMTEIAETISKIENFSEAAQSLELARTTAVSITDSLDKAWVLISIAEAYSQLKNPAAASEVLKSALEVTMQINNSRSQFFALIAIAEAIGQLNQPQQASQVLEQAITAANQFDNLSAKADALIVIAETAGQIENFPKAANSLELALATADSITDSYNKARVLTTIVETAGQIENFPEAVQSLELATAAVESIPDSYTKAQILTTIAETAGQIDNFPKAAQSLELAITAAQKISNSYNKARVLITIAEAISQLNQPEQAAELLQDAIASANQIEDSSYRALALSAFAEAIGQLNLPEAVQLLQDAITSANQIEDAYDQANTLRAIADAYSKLKQPEQAAELLQDAIASAKQIEDASDRAEFLRTIIQTQAKLNHWRDARNTASLCHSYECKVESLANILTAWAENKNPALTEKKE